MVEEATKILNGNGSLDDFGKLLDESWKIKKSLSSEISNSHIDVAAAAKEAGALGGKLLGAGRRAVLFFFRQTGTSAVGREKVKKFTLRSH